jgi:hypothetical protein
MKGILSPALSCSELQTSKPPKSPGPRTPGGGKTILIKTNDFNDYNLEFYIEVPLRGI